MIKGKQLTERPALERSEVNYRKLEALNQSMLKVFDENPVQFYNEFKLGKKRKQKVNNSLIIGDLVDFFLLECGGMDEEFESRFDEKFALFQGSKGSGQVFLLADYLFEETENCTNEKGEITCSFMERFKIAYSRVRAEDKYKGDKNTLEKVLEDFEKNGKDYFQMRMDNVGKTVVDISLVDKARIVANGLTTDVFTADIFKDTGNPEIERFTHFPIEFKYPIMKGAFIACKAELDILHIDHKKKLIQPIDLKTTYDNESFDYMYIKNGYYIQNAFYWKAVSEWAKENDLADYTVNPMYFVVGDTSANNRRPLLYETTGRDVDGGIDGFELRGTKYRGVHELIMDIAWAETVDEWKCSKDAFDNKGRMKLNVRYD